MRKLWYVKSSVQEKDDYFEKMRAEEKASGDGS